MSAGMPLLEGRNPLQVQGRDLLQALYTAAQSLRIFPLENATVQNALAELHRAVQQVVAHEGAIDLHLVGDFFFLNDARLRLDLSNFAAFAYVSTLLVQHGIGVVEVGRGIAREEWAPFLSLLLRSDGGEDPFARFIARLRESPVRHIVVGPVRERGAGTVAEADQGREAAKRAYFQSVHVAREVMSDVRLGRAVNVRRVKRAVQSIVDQVLNHETSIVGMTTLRDYDEYTFTHSVNVCILSVVIGQKLGLSKMQLYELGVAALFHDIGKMRIDAEVVNKPSRLTEEEFARIQQHPTEGLLELFSVRGFSEMPYRAMLVAYEHHMKRDLTGYPQNRRPRRSSLFTRIVATADGFDAATSKRSYQPFPSTADAVLREMRDEPRRGYDPLLVKAFINVIGAYPIGTLVVLDTFELAVVLEPNADPKLIHQPVVAIITDPVGLRLPAPRRASLSELDPETGRPRRSIIMTTDPEKYGIRVGDYFL